MIQSVPRWMQAYAQPAGRAPQKAPPAQGVPRVERYSIPLELRYHRAWACWRYEYENNRWSKPPYNPETREKAEPSNADTWLDFDTCFAAYQSAGTPNSGGRPYDGVSFALDIRWGIVGVDLDHVSDHRAAADAIVHTLDTYAELSPSGDGYRLFCKGMLPEGRRRRDWVEMYCARRFLTVTGLRLPHTPDHLTTPRALYGTWERYLNRS